MDINTLVDVAARGSLAAYSMALWPQFQAAPHHLLIADALRRVSEGKCKRLMVAMPPRHGKSLLCSEMFPAWFMGRHPDKYIICATYAQDLADDFGRKVRNNMQSAEHRRFFPNSILRSDSSSAQRFHTEAGGVYYAVGVGGALTGRGAHVLLVDDPLKGREDADSERKRKTLQDWYNSVAYTRLMPGGAVIVIQTRWHDDDLAGWLLTEHAHEEWETLVLPAIDSDGKALWPGQYPIDVLTHIKRTIGERDWSALYQQEPLPDSGEFFKREWLRWYGAKPEHLRIYMASDFAVTDGSGDYTEHGVFGVDPNDNLYVLDWWHGQTAPDAWIDAMLDMVQRWKPLAWYGESGVIRRSVEPFLAKRMQERRVYCRTEWVASISDKPTRARGFQARCSMGKVYFPAGQDWSDRLTAQLMRFPAGKHDDAVDVCSLIGRAIDDLSTAQVPHVKPKKENDYVLDYDDEEDSWKTV